MRTYLENIRRNKKISYESIAKLLQISRPTVVSIFNGKRELTVTEAKKLASVFGLPFLDLVNEAEMNHTLTIANLPRSRIVVSMPEESLDKIKEGILLILREAAGYQFLARNFLSRTLFLVEFAYYQLKLKKVFSLTYIKTIYGPTPFEFNLAIKELVDEGALQAIITKNSGSIYLPLRSASLDLFYAEELDFIRITIEEAKSKVLKERAKYILDHTAFKNTVEGVPISFDDYLV